MSDHRDWADSAKLLVDEKMVASVAHVLLAEPSPSGVERSVAERLVAWGRMTGPGLNWDIQHVGPDRANLLAWSGDRGWENTRGTWFYAHLDHTLSGDPAQDRPLTGWGDAPSPPMVSDLSVRGLGLAVARGPAICAVVAAQALAATDVGRTPLGVLLAAGGTHRSPSPSVPVPVGGAPGIEVGLGLGVGAALATSWRPDEVVNVKGGATGVLSSEPGCLMLQVSWREPFTALPARGAHGGAAVVGAYLTLAVQGWRDSYRRSSAAGQIAADLCVGHVSSGVPYKTDVQPGEAVLGVYLATTPGLDAAEAAARLEVHLWRALEHRGLSRRSGELTVVPYAGHEAAPATAESAPVVQAARAAWDRRHGEGSSQVRGYRGSTDGGLFRAQGIPTVRFGPTARPTPSDPTIEELSMQELVEFVHMYIETVAEVATRRERAMKPHVQEIPSRGSS